MFATDGLTEITDQNDLLFSEENLMALLRSHGHKSAEEIRNAILAELGHYAYGTEQADDQTIVVVKALVNV